MPRSSITPLHDDEQLVVSVTLTADELANSTDMSNWMTDTFDLVRVFLLNHDTWLDWMAQEHVQVYPNSAKGDASVFHLCQYVRGYHFIVSPEYDYPDNYVYTMVQKVNQYKRQAIVGTAGGYVMYPKGFRALPFNEPLHRDLPVHCLDVKAIAYHARSVRLADPRKPADPPTISLAVYAQEQAVPMVAIAHRSNWVTPMRRRSTSEEPHGQLVKRYRNWRLFSVESKEQLHV